MMLSIAGFLCLGWAAGGVKDGVTDYWLGE